jgi:hypothetical protein
MDGIGDAHRCDSAAGRPAAAIDIARAVLASC